MKVAATDRLVLDASIALAWCFPDEESAASEAILDLLSAGREAFVPVLWPLEVGNALLVAERRKRITVAQVTSVLQRIARLPITVVPLTTGRAFGSILYLARQEQLTEYDAAYLDLSLREGLPLATLDDDLRRAARRAGIDLITS